MGLHSNSPALLTVLLVLVAGTQANTLYVFDFYDDLQGWESLRGSWRWSNASSLQNTIPSDYKGGFAVMDDEDYSDELYTPYFRVPNGGNFTMRFYLRSRYIASNDLQVYTRNRQFEVKDFLDLKEYSVDYSFYWITITKELPPDDEEVRFEIFCYNGETAPSGEPLLGCAIDQLAFEVYDDNTTPAPGNTTTTTTIPGNTTTTTTIPGNTTATTIPGNTTTTTIPGNTTTTIPGNTTTTTIPDNTTNTTYHFANTTVIPSSTTRLPTYPDTTTKTYETTYTETSTHTTT